MTQTTKETANQDIVERLRSPEVFIMDGGLISPVAFEAADEIERLREQENKMTTHALVQMEEIERLREALFTILCNTDPHAIRHRDYDHLAKNIFDCASAALKEKE